MSRLKEVILEADEEEGEKIKEEINCWLVLALKWL